MDRRKVLKELSRKTLGSYIKKALGPKDNQLGGLSYGGNNAKTVNKWNKRASGITLAVNKLTNKKPTKQAGKVSDGLERPNSARVLAKEETVSPFLQACVDAINSGANFTTRRTKD